MKKSWSIKMLMMVWTVLLVVQPGCSGTGPGNNVVDMVKDHRFKPEKITIHAGDTVTWKNKSELVHTVTCVPDKALDAADVHLPEGAKTFNSGKVDPGGTFSHVFTVPGVYKYFCMPHETLGMTGQVIVKEK